MASSLGIDRLIIGTFLVMTIWLSIIDWKYMILPTKIIYFGLVIGIVEYMIKAILQREWAIFCFAAIGGVIGYGTFALFFYGSKWILKKEGMGYGDVRLMGLVGLFVGVKQLGLVILIATISASIYGLILLKIKRESTPYPFGPFLSIGGSITLIWGTQIIDRYMNLL